GLRYGSDQPRGWARTIHRPRRRPRPRRRRPGLGQRGRRSHRPGTDTGAQYRRPLVLEAEPRLTARPILPSMIPPSPGPRPGYWERLVAAEGHSQCAPEASYIVAAARTAR